MPRKVCLSGFAKISREWANQQSEDTEIWGMNEGHAFLKREPNRWFQIHSKTWNKRACDLEGWDNDGYGRHPAHLKWLSKQKCPVYMQEIDDRIPTAVKYPLGEILSTYGRYVTSTTAYMLALLLYEHEKVRWWNPWSWKNRVESVALAGIELAIGTEYMIQRPCVEYFLGKLESKGVKILPTPTGSSLLHSPWVYAVDHDTPILEGDLVPVLAQNFKTSGVPQVKFLEEDTDGNLVMADKSA